MESSEGWPTEVWSMKSAATRAPAEQSCTAPRSSFWSAWGWPLWRTFLRSRRCSRMQEPSGRPSPRTDRPKPATPGESGERLQKTLARAGLGSRRSVEELIRAGRVRVDGRMAELGQRVEPARARITVDGTPVPADPDLRYFALNKPAGVTTTMRDPHA